MAEVKWIKITTDIFDDEKILLIESLPDSYAIITVWFKLLCLAGKQNNSGVFMMGRIPYTEGMLATIFRMKETTVKLALETFVQFGMVEIIDGVITIPNWEKHQSLDQLEQARANTRERVARHREKQRLLAQGEEQCNATVTQGVTLQVTPCNGDRVRLLEQDKEQDKEQDIHTTAGACMSVQDIIGLFNSLCPSFPSVQVLNETRRVKIVTLLNTYSVDQFKQCFENAEVSSFLKGGGKTGWKASFDWIIDAENFPKVLEGNYANKKRYSREKPRYGNFDPDEAFQIALDRSYQQEPKEEPKTAGNDEAIRERAEALQAELQQRG